jgi:hypothetical protein
MATKHVTHLEKLRAHLLAERRKLAEKMATGQNMPKSFDKFVDLQEALEAIGHAIKDEEEREAKAVADKAMREAADKASAEVEHSRYLDDDPMDED